MLAKTSPMAMKVQGTPVNSLPGTAEKYRSPDTVKFSREIIIPPNFTAECAENAEAVENQSEDRDALVLNPQRSPR